MPIPLNYRLFIDAHIYQYPQIYINFLYYSILPLMCLCMLLKRPRDLFVIFISVLYYSFHYRDWKILSKYTQGVRGRDVRWKVDLPVKLRAFEWLELRALLLQWLKVRPKRPSIHRVQAHSRDAHFEVLVLRNRSNCIVIYFRVLCLLLVLRPWSVPALGIPKNPRVTVKGIHNL